MNEYKAIRIAEGFTAIEENGVRSFLFEGENGALLVDSGFGTGDLKTFIATLTDKPVTGVVLTHADMDHTGGCKQFDTICLHPAEYDRYCEKNPEDAGKLRPVWEGDELVVGDYALTVLLIPGHTPGSIALLDRKHRFLLGGDTVQNSSIFMFGAGRNVPAFIASIEKLEELAGAFDIVYASHGDLTVTPDILPALREGAADMLAGKIEGQDPGRPFPCRLYDCGRVHFLYGN